MEKWVLSFLLPFILKGFIISENPILLPSLKYEYITNFLSFNPWVSFDDLNLKRLSDLPELPDPVDNIIQDENHQTIPQAV